MTLSSMSPRGGKVGDEKRIEPGEKDGKANREVKTRNASGELCMSEVIAFTRAGGPEKGLDGTRSIILTRPGESKTENYTSPPVQLRSQSAYT